MKVTIDRNGCTGCSVCWAQCSEVFDEGTDGKSVIVGGLRVGDDPALGEAPEDFEACAKEAASSCPVSVIKVG
jgi:ferredoxin